MENSDFRRRLKNHQTDYNPDAWKQMSEMIDALPAELEDKKDKKWILILLLLLVLTAMTITLMYNIGFQRNSVSEQLTKQENKVSNNLSENAIQKFEPLNSRISENNKIEIKELVQKHYRNGKTNSVLGSYPEKKEVRKTNFSSIDLNNEEQEVEEQEVQFEIADSQITSSSFSKNISDGYNITKEDRTAEDKSKSKGLQSESPLTSNDAGSNRNPILEKTELSMGLIKPFNNIRTLPFKELNFVEKRDGDYRFKSNSQISIVKKRKKYWFGSVGVSDINGARGYYLGTGLFMDLDKVAAVELDIGLSGANDRRYDVIESVRLFSSDLELGTTLWLHLNLMRKNAHKLSLELGPSVQCEWATNKTNFDGSGGSTTSVEYSNLGWNFRGGVSYTYFLSNQSGIGLKGAFSLYDSGYVSLKYYKRI